MTRHAFATVSVQHEQSVDGPSDEALFAAYRDHGDRQAFDQLVHRYERELFAYLCRFLNNSAAAEDVFQNTFLQIHQRSHQFEGGRAFRPWLYSIANHLAIDSQRYKRRRRAVSLDREFESDEDSAGSLAELIESRESSPLAQIETVENRAWIREALANLPEHLRSVLTMLYYQGLKYTEVSEALKIPIGTVKSRMSAAILRLNKAWHATVASESENPPHA